MDKPTVPAGYKQTEIGVIPEEWSVNSFDQICRVNQGLQIAIERRKKTPTTRSKIYITVQYVNSNDAPEYIDDYSSAVCCEPNDVLMTRTGNTGMVVTGQTGVFHNNFFKINFNKERISAGYFVYSLRSHDCQKTILEKAGTSTIPDLNHGDFYSIKIAIPSIVEQTAIANALSDVDALIAALEKLFNKKNAIKTAAMQQLLTGKKRLPPFDQLNSGYKQTELGEIPGDWAVEAVHQLLRENPKYGINAAAVPLTANLPVYIRITDISDDGYFQPSERVGVNNQFSNFYKLQKGDIVIARTGASVGKSYLYREADGELIYAGFLIKLSPKESILDSMFLFQYLHSDPYWAWVNVMSMRSGQPGINGNEFGSLQIPLPSVDEQTAIANVLADMDKDLEALQLRLHKTQQIKQGMMQELLTGKTRLVK
nr:restriction endonuclease subunit S [uncultured Undibacterium sp.]